MTAPGTVLERGEAKPPVDPRLRARRIEVRRREGRRRLRRLVALLIVTVVCVGAWGISRSPLLDVDHIEVSGVRRANTAQVIALSGIERGDALVDLDLGAARTAIAELGWVQSVEASHTWRGTVQLTVVERTPVAVLAAADGTQWLAAADGTVIDVAGASDVAALPVVEGVEVPAPGGIIDTVHRRGVRAAIGLSAGLASWVESISIDESGELWLDLEEPEGSDFAFDGTRARLGDARDLAAQLVAVETILARVDLECLALIDARVGSAPVVTRHPACGAEA